MNVKIKANNINQKADSGETILSALKRIGINIPTLCNMEDLSPTGACRLCVVEDAITGELITSCSTPVRDKLEILTHSPKVIEARKTIVELLLTNHPENCLYCDKSGNCELQRLAEELNIREKTFYGDKPDYKTDRSSPGIVRDMSKCILCGRCVRICEEVLEISAIDLINRGKKTRIETVFQKGLYYSDCIHCGLCISACPTGAILEKSNLNELINRLGKEDKKKSIFVSSISIAYLAQRNNIRKYEDCRNYIVGALHDAGFDNVYTSAILNDYFTSEACNKIENNLKKDKTTIITDCPAVKKYLRNQDAELFEKLIDIPNPMQLTGDLFNKVIDFENDCMVSTVPCIAHKYEAIRSENTIKGVPKFEFVLTSNELDKMLHALGLSLPYTKKETPDKPSNSDSSSGVFFETKHGITEAIIRELSFRKGIVNKLNRIIEIKTDKDFIEYEFNLGKTKHTVACIYGVNNIKKYRSKILKSKYLFVELRSCEFGCIDGCGQTKTSEKEQQKKIRKIISYFDEKNNNNTAGKNPYIKGIYRLKQSEK